MATIHEGIKVISRIIPAVCLLLLLGTMAASAAPPIPSGFYGTVTVNGVNASDGTAISAWINGVKYVEALTFTATGASYYTIDVPGDDTETSGTLEGGVGGNTVMFKVNGQDATQTGVWQTGSNQELNLTAAGNIGSDMLVTLPANTSALMGTTTIIPVALGSDSTGKGILSYEFSLQYDSAVIEFVEVMKSGTASASWQIEANESPAGITTVAAYGTDPLVGGGSLVQLKFNMRSGCSATDIVFNDFKFNEGTPTVQTTNGHVVCTTLGIAGTTTYLLNGSPVSETQITLTGDSADEATTDATGHFTVNAQSFGAHTVSATKQDDHRDAITALDASFILQYRAGKIALTPDQKKAADVSQADDVSAYDAALIARFVVGKPSLGSKVGQWSFTPATYVHNELTVPITRQDFTAMLFGDVTGDWNAGVARTSQPDNLDAALQMSDVSGFSGQKVNIHFSLEGAMRADVRALQFDLLFDSQFLANVQISLAPEFRDNWGIAHNERDPGRLTVVGFSDGLIPASGPLFILTGELMGKLGESSKILVELERMNETAIRRSPRVLGEAGVHYPLFLPTTMR